MTPYLNIYGVIPSPTTVTVLTGRGTVSEKCTRGIPVVNPIANLGIGTLTQDDDVIMENARTVPQASSANVGATVPLASSATASTSMDVDALHTPVNDMTEAEEWATAEIYE